MQQEHDFIKFILAKKNKLSYNEKEISKDLREIFSEVEDYQKKQDDPYYICKNTNILQIFHSSWLDENVQYSENMFHYLVSLYLLDCINSEIYRSGIQELFFNKSLSIYES